jgi:hypothetical protein
MMTPQINMFTEFDVEEVMTQMISDLFDIIIAKEGSGHAGRAFDRDTFFKAAVVRHGNPRPHQHSLVARATSTDTSRVLMSLCAARLEGQDGKVRLAEDF